VEIDRTSSSGFLIHLIERADESETVVEIEIIGWFDHNGELFNFP
jgi:hypothetical protein